MKKNVFLFLIWCIAIPILFAQSAPLPDSPEGTAISLLASGKLGDVDNSGLINIIDALMTAQYVVGLNPQPFETSQGDVNRDGIINIIDALMIAQHYVGIIQLEGTPSPVPTPTPPPVTTPGPLKNLTIFIAGDSTVMSYPSSYAPQEGWGQELGQFFNSMISINNQALGGRSSRTFTHNVLKDSSGNVLVDSSGKPRLETDSSGKLVDAVRWARIKANIRQGDYLLIQFGTNDSSSGNLERYCTVTDFKGFLTEMIDTTRSKNAIPVLVTPTAQRGSNNSRLKPYADAMKELGSAKGVDVIDLNGKSYQFVTTASQATLDSIFLPGDSTHFQKAGAIKMSELIVQELRRLNHFLVAYLK